jgi:hypothetical protein
MTVVLTGANPGVLLREAGEVTAFASVWQVDWSEHGSGPAIVLWHAGRVRLLGPDPELAAWLAETFVRHFGEVAGLPWEPRPAETTDVQTDLDLGRGLVAKAGDVVVEIDGVLDRRPFAQDGLDFGGVRYALSNVYAPCRTARITVAGTAVPGVPEVDADGPSSTAFLAVAESWTRED